MGRVPTSTLPAVQHALAIVAAYLIGSVNFGILVAASRGVDIRSVGSGNPGTSNVLRVLGTRLAAVVLLGDALKGVIAAAIGVAVGDAVFGYATLAAAVVGHAFPIWHRFRGGKSVATALGGIAYLAPIVGISLAILWIVILVVWKTASVASLVVMALLVPLLALAGRSSAELLWAAGIALFVIVRHAENIRGLATSTERKV